MLDDYDLFIQLCRKRGVLATTKVSEAVRLSSTNESLDLSCSSMIMPICEILSQVISSSSRIKSVDLSDCMLHTNALSCILNALREGSVVSSLNLKGNNISGTASEQLANVFICNNTLKRVHIEWNGIGAQASSFDKFCEGLCKNYQIEELDLRYNQISPRCAEALSKLIRRNKTLKSIDLAWNTLGLHGGQLIHEAMKENKSLRRLDLKGNCIPNGVLRAIEACVSENQSSKPNRGYRNFKENARSISASDNDSDDDSHCGNRVAAGLKPSNRQKIRKKHKPTITTEHSFSENEDDMKNSLSSSSSNSVGEKVSPKCTEVVEELRRLIPSSRNLKASTETKTPMSVDAMSVRIEELNSMLQERMKVIDMLTNELAEKAKESDTKTSQMVELQIEINKLKEDAEKKRKNKEDSEKEQTRVYKELQDNFKKLGQSKKDLELALSRCERDSKKSWSEVFGLKEKLSSSTQAYEDLISHGRTEIHKLGRELKEREARQKIELNMVRSTLKETTHALEECQAQLQKSRGEIRELAENGATLKEKLCETERIAAKYSRCEETLQKVKAERDDLGEKYENAKRSLVSLQKQSAAFQAELIEPQRKYDLLKDELDQERRRSTRLEQEALDERVRMKEKDEQVHKLTVQLGNLNGRINEMQEIHAEVLKERDKGLHKLQESLTRKERDFSDLKADQVQRASQLYAAFNKYLESISQNPTS